MRNNVERLSRYLEEKAGIPRKLSARSTPWNCIAAKAISDKHFNRG